MTPFHTERHLAATPADVFAAISDPKRLERWWGPAGFTNTFHTCDFTPGGAWRLTMHGPDGKSYPNESTFAAIETNKRVVIDHLSLPHYQLVIELTPSDGGTLVTWTQTFEKESVAAGIRHIVEPANEQNLDRLAAEVGASTSH